MSRLQNATATLFSRVGPGPLHVRPCGTRPPISPSPSLSSSAPSPRDRVQKDVGGTLWRSFRRGVKQSLQALSLAVSCTRGGQHRGLQCRHQRLREVQALGACLGAFRRSSPAASLQLQAATDQDMTVATLQVSAMNGGDLITGRAWQNHQRQGFMHRTSFLRSACLRIRLLPDVVVACPNFRVRLSGPVKVKKP